MSGFNSRLPYHDLFTEKGQSKTKLRQLGSNRLLPIEQSCILQDLLRTFREVARLPYSSLVKFLFAAATAATMLITAAKFDELLKNGTLRISLIGMSNVGKTRRAKSLVADLGLNFRWMCVDDLVEAKLNPFLEGKGFKGVNGVAEWMGQPYEARYSETQRFFLKFEEEAMAEIDYSVQKNLIIDTTGSVIYLSQEALQQLRQKTLIVYLEATEDIRKLLFERYMSNPKPVVWGSSFNQEKGESGLDALKRCYPQLLEYRAAKYSELADIAIPHNVLRDTSGRQFLEEVRKRL